MGYHKTLTDDVLAWRELREQINLRGRQVLRRVMNKALEHAEEQFVRELHAGGLASLELGEGEVETMLLEAAKEELG